nr:oligopepetide transporter OPT/MTD1 [Phaffia rhodozyma]
MLGSAVVPGNAQANMYFGLYGSNAATQGIAFASDLKIAQYTKLPPRTTLWVQSLGTVLGGILQIVISKQIIGSHRDILLDPAGNNIWSGQNVQSFNSQAVTWGALAKDMYSPGSTYDMIPLSVLVGFGVPIIPWIIHRYYPKLRMDLFITPLFCYTLGYLAAGINSTIFMSVVTALLTQGYLRIYRPTWFRKYNYIMSAALDAGMQVFVFITTFALFGAGNGTTVAMPNWALNPVNYADYCYLDDSS